MHTVVFNILQALKLRMLCRYKIRTAAWIYFGNSQSVYTIFGNQLQIFPAASNFTHDVPLDFCGGILAEDSG